MLRKQNLIEIVENMDVKTDYYFAMLPNEVSKEIIQQIQQQFIRQSSFLNKVDSTPETYWHVTEFYFPSIDKLNTAFIELGIPNQIELNQFQHFFQEIIENYHHRIEHYTITGIKRMGDKAISLLLEKNGQEEIFNEKICSVFRRFLKNQNIADKDIERLLNYENFSFKYHRQEKFVPHMTIGKIKDFDDIENINHDLQLMLKPYIGSEIYLENMKLKANR